MNCFTILSKKNKNKKQKIVGYRLGAILDLQDSYISLLKKSTSTINIFVFRSAAIISLQCHQILLYKFHSKGMVLPS